MHDQILELKEKIAASSRIVFLGGAGVSTEGGIPDFRSSRGIYNQAYPYPPEDVLSIGFFRKHPDIFYEFYREKCLRYIATAKPHAGHMALARLEEDGKLSAVVTQNIDGLHQAAGSKEVLELHGTALTNPCVSCGRVFGIEDLLSGGDIPRCSCGGIIRPGCVLYGEKLDPAVFERSCEHLREADLLIVAGTSLAVYPAAGLVDDFGGGCVAVINRDPLPLHADITIQGSVGDVLSQV